MSIRTLFASLLAVALVAQAPPPPSPPDGKAPMPPPGRMGMRGPGMGQGMGPGMGPGMGQGMGPGQRAALGAQFMARHLKLTEPQIAKIKELRTKGQEGIQARQKAAQEARQAVAKAAARPDATVAGLKALHQAAADRQFEVLSARLATRQEVRAVLTPEQRVESDRLMALAQERREFMRERMQQRMKQGGGMMGHPGMGHPGMRGPGGLGQGWGDGPLEDWLRP